MSGHLTLTQISRDDGQCGDSKCSIGVRDGIDDGGEASALSDEVTACEDNEGEVMAIDGEGECVEEGDTCAGKLVSRRSRETQLICSLLCCFVECGEVCVSGKGYAVLV